MPQINQQALSFQSVNGQKIPDEGPKSITVPLDFTQGTTLTLDLQNVMQRSFFSMIQAVYLDNKDGNSTLDVTFGASSQRVSIAPNRQGYRMVQAPNPVNNITFTSNAGILLSCLLLNYPVTTADWPAITGA